MHTVEKMPSRLKFNSAVLFVLTGLFVFAVYNLSRLRVPPFGLDPCDAVMHFAVFTVVIALIGSLRSLLTYQKRMSPAAQDTHVLRSQQAVALAVLIAFSAYAVGLARHPSAWISAEWRNQLIVWLCVFLTVAAAMELLVLSARPSRTKPVTRHCGPAVLACSFGFAALVFCPEYGGNPLNETAHVLTVIIGGLIVLIPMVYLLPFLVPNQPGDNGRSRALFSTSSERGALIIGILFGIFLFWVDAHRAEAARALLPAMKLIGRIFGFLIVYAFLAERLGLAGHLRSTR
jgi:cytochrome bd-type quinol oxidase subunit 2